MKLNPSSILTIVILIISAIFGGVSLTYEEMKMKLLPVTLSSLIFVLSVIQLWKDFRKPQTREEPEIEAENKETEKREMRGDITGLAWLAGFSMATYLVGFLISIPLFIFIYLKAHCVSWLNSIIFSVTGILITYLLFVLVLKVDFFPGLLLSGL
jgi:hypothetical protein